MAYDVPNPGSVVRCVNAHDTNNHLKEGQVYKVHHTQFSGRNFTLKLVGVEGFWKANRFVKVGEDETSNNSTPS